MSTVYVASIAHPCTLGGEWLLREVFFSKEKAEEWIKTLHLGESYLTDTKEYELHELKDSETSVNA